MLMQSVLLLLLILCGIALAAVISSDDYELEEDVTCKDTEDCIRVTKCGSAEYAVVFKKVHHGYARCGWYKFEELVCCPKKENVTLRLGNNNKTETACNTFIKSRIQPLVEGQIMGGEKAIAGEFPHMAVLGHSADGRQIFWGSCGGTLISYNYVLTAAHCLSFPAIINNAQGEMKVFAVRLGKLDKTGNSDGLSPQDHRVEHIEYYTEYNPYTNHHDIALLRLETPVNITEYVSPACLYQETEDPKKNITVSGWGYTKANGNPSSLLQKTVLKAFDTVSCRDRYSTLKPPRQIITSQMCAVSFDDKKRDTCKGDSGGPAQITDGNVHFIVGVTSFGHCGSTPGVYTRVASYIPWIEGIIWS